MQVPAHGRLWDNQTICGIPIPKSAEGVYGYFVRSVSICHKRLVGFARGSTQEPSEQEKAGDALAAHHEFMSRLDEAERHTCAVAQRLIDARDNPANYGDNLPGWFDANGNPITPARFSFSDLIGYGPDPDTGGVQGFLTRCDARSYEELDIAAGLLTLDEAMQFAETDLAYAFHLLGEAQALQDGIETTRMRHELSTQVPEEALERAFSVKQGERARARYAHDRDGKQAAKAEVKDWWLKWQSDPTLYRSAAAFARAMLDKYPTLDSQPVIEQWVRGWKKES
jgi:hypothetical protein